MGVVHRQFRVRAFIATGASVALAAGLVVGVPIAAEGAESARTFTGTVSIPGAGGGVVPGANVQIRGDWSQYCSADTDAAGAFTLTGCNLDDNTPFRVFVTPPYSLYAADDTVANSGATLFPGIAAVYTWTGLGGGGVLGNLNLAVANMKGTVKKQADDSSVTQSDFYGNIVPLESNGGQGNTQIPLAIYSNGTFRNAVSGTSHGVLIKVTPQQNPTAGTFDDTFAPAATGVSQSQLNAGVSNLDVVMPRVNFWGLVKKANGTPATNIWVEGKLGSGGSQQEIWGQSTDDSAIIRLYIDRTLSGAGPSDQPVTFRMNFNNSDGGQKQRTYMLADDSGMSISSPMIVEPQADNLIVKVVRDDSTGPAEVGAWVNVNVPNCNSDCQVFSGTTNGSGEVGGYTASPATPKWVQVNAVTSGYSNFGSSVSATLVGGVYRITVVLKQVNYRVIANTPGYGSGVDSGAWVSVNLPNSDVQYIGTSTNSSGQADGHVPTPTSPMWVNVNPSNAAQAAGFTQSSGLRTATWNAATSRYEVQVNLRRGNLTLTLQTATGSPVANTWVNLNDANGMQWLGGQMTDDSGSARFAVDNPGGPFQVQTNQLPPALSALGYAGFSGLVEPDVSGSGDSAQGTATITLQLANVNISVKDEANQPVPGAGIWLQPMGAEQGYNGQADDSGVIRLNVPAQYLNGLFHMNVQPPWFDQASFASRNYNDARLTCPGGGQPCTFNAVLQAPNARFKVVAPHSNSVPMPWANLEFRVPNDWSGGAWANSNQQGLVGATLEDDTYELYVQAPWNNQDDTMYAAAKYIVSVSGGAVQSVTRNGVPASQTDGRWLISPAVAAYSTTVVGPVGDDSRANSWVEVMKISEGGWQEYITGSSTNTQGRVGFTLDDDTYVLRARAPWGTSGLAPSRDCTLIIQAGAVASGTTCGAIMRLRAPNFRVRMVDPGGDGVGGGWACVGRENDWNWSCEGSNFNGYVSFMIDDTQAGNLIVEGNPPFTSEDFAPARNIVNDDSFIGVDTLDDTLVFKVPNVRVQVTLDDDTEAARWSWVNIVRIVDDTTWEWVGGAPANLSGMSQFNLDDTSGRFCVEAYPPWEVRETYGPQTECGLGILATGELAIDLRTANVISEVVDSDGRRNQFGWAEIQPISPAGDRWGVGLDDRGRFAAALDPGATYDITFYPGWQRSGSPTTVTVTVTGDGSDIPSTVQLGSGNVVGEVTGGGSAYPGVVVVAEQGGQRIAAVTDDAGAFRLELGSGTWTITAIPPPGGASATVSITSGGVWTSPQLVVP